MYIEFTVSEYDGISSRFRVYDANNSDQIDYQKDASEGNGSKSVSFSLSQHQKSVKVKFYVEPYGCTVAITRIRIA